MTFPKTMLGVVLMRCVNAEEYRTRREELSRKWSEMGMSQTASDDEADAVLEVPFRRGGVRHLRALAGCRLLLRW